MAEHIVGIDLGTSNSCIASYTGKKAEVIRNALGDSLTPSVVAYGADGSLLVGAPARRQAIMNPKSTFFEVKRLCGRRFDEKEVSLAQKILPYDIVKATNGDAWVSYEGTPISPEEIQAYILESLRKTAVTFWSKDIIKAVITVPAFFDETQRQAVRDAASIAGMEAVRILSEPTAAAMAYGHGKFNGRIAVIDFGGGTFDVTLMEVKAGVFRVLATDGDNLLGGADFDQAIAKHLATTVLKESQMDPLEDPVAKQRLMSEAEKIKKTLSTQDKAHVELQYLLESASGPVNLKTTLSKEEYNSLVAPLVTKMERPCTEVMSKGGLGKGDVDEVLLVGGMSRSPLVQEKVFEIFGRKPSQKVNPDEAIALGAAIAAAGISGECEGATLVDVAPRTVGLAGANDAFIPLIKATTPLPAKVKKRFATTKDNQRTFSLILLQGESEKSSANKRLARVAIEDIPEGVKGSVHLDLEFSMNENGQFLVNAKTGDKVLKAPVNAVSGLTASQVETLSEKGRKRRGETQYAGKSTTKATSDAELLGNFAIDFSEATPTSESGGKPIDLFGSKSAPESGAKPIDLSGGTGDENNASNSLNSSKKTATKEKLPKAVASRSNNTSLSSSKWIGLGAFALILLGAIAYVFFR